MITSFFAALLFYILPVLTGRLFTKNLFYAWFCGALSWFSLYFAVAGILTIFPIASFPSVIRILAIFISIVSLIKIGVELFMSSRMDVRDPLQETRFLSRLRRIEMTNALFMFLLSVIAAFTYFFIWKRLTPYPLQLNWDIYEHITLASQIAVGNIHILPSHISDTFTFNGYSPLFHVLLSLPHITMGADFLGMYWWVEFFHFLLTILASYLLGKLVFTDPWKAFVAGIVGLFVFESSIVYASLFLIPQTFTAVLVMLSAYALLKEHGAMKKAWIPLIFVTLFLLHYLIGTAGILLLSFFLFYTYHTKQHSPHLTHLSRWLFTGKALTYLEISALGVFLLVCGLHFLGSMTITGREEALHYTFSLQEIFSYFFNWYGATLLFLPVGIWTCFTANHPRPKILLIAALVCLSVAVLPLSYFLKFYVLGRYLINTILAIGIVTLIKYLPNYLKYVGILGAILCFLVVFTQNQAAYKEFLYEDGSFSHISKAEITAAKVLTAHFGNNAFLISDPTTQCILEAVSGNNSQGGCYMDTADRDTVAKLYPNPKPETILPTLNDVMDAIPSVRGTQQTSLFVVSGRYFAWQRLSKAEKESFFTNIWTPQKIQSYDMPYIDMLSKTPRLHMIYKNDEIVIFQII